MLSTAEINFSTAVTFASIVFQFASLVAVAEAIKLCSASLKVPSEYVYAINSWTVERFSTVTVEIS